MCIRDRADADQQLAARLGAPELSRQRDVERRAQHLEHIEMGRIGYDDGYMSHGHHMPLPLAPVWGRSVAHRVGGPEAEA